MILIYLVDFNLSDNEQLIEDIWHKKNKKRNVVRDFWTKLKLCFLKIYFLGCFFKSQATRQVKED